MVNGVPVFMKGANWIPADSFVTRVTAERYRALLQRPPHANMNMLRVWGGGIYEDDRFYEICDELGLLVWQDFMFACSMYPGDAAFVENVRQEAIENVRRLRNHPALALWAGNNEIEAAWQQWGWHVRSSTSARRRRTTIWNDYKRLFHEVLPRVVAARGSGALLHALTRRARTRTACRRTSWAGATCTTGASGTPRRPYEAYAANVSRFMSEYGFQSFPTLDSVARYAPPSEWRIDSPVMLSHQRHPRGNPLVRTYMDRDFRVPKDFGAFLYLSARCCRRPSSSSAPRRTAAACPYNVGSLYWQLDDCWPVASWSSIDYYGRWKALQYAARRFFAPVLVIARRRQRDLARLRRIGSPQRSTGPPDLAPGRSSTAAANAGGSSATSPSRRSRASRCSRPGSATCSRAIDPSHVVLVAELTAGGQTLSRNLFYFLKTRELALPAPELSVAVTPHRIGATVRVTARRFARAVWLSTPAGEGAFSDNFFDLLPGETATVEWTPGAGARPGAAERLASVLHATTVRDTY